MKFPGFVKAYDRIMRAGRIGQKWWKDTRQRKDGFKIIIVSGTYVRNNFDSDFVQGGNGERYDFIPTNELWIEKSMPKSEQAFVLEHEYEETMLMRQGMSYSAAHDIAKKHEDESREKHRSKK